MARRMGYIYGWENAKIVIDYLEAMEISYMLHAREGIWAITYDLETGKFDALPDICKEERDDTD